jgi:hypothetical protein
MCTLHLDKDIIYSKAMLSDEDCKYYVKVSSRTLKKPKFIAPCDWYDIGDSINIRFKE